VRRAHLVHTPTRVTRRAEAAEPETSGLTSEFIHVPRSNDGDIQIAVWVRDTNSAVLRNHVRPIAKIIQFITRERLWRKSESTASHIESRRNRPSNVVLERFWADPCSTDHPFGKYNMTGCPTQRVVQPAERSAQPGALISGSVCVARDRGRRKREIGVSSRIRTFYLEWYLSMISQAVAPGFLDEPSCEIEACRLCIARQGDRIE
jgi:hypothetical protein